METTTQLTTIALDSPRNLPGHEHGRQRLVNALDGLAPYDRLEVRGHWSHDEFIVAELRVWDTECDCWSSDLGDGGWAQVA